MNSARAQLLIWIALLTATGLSIAIYKHVAFGFPWLPGEQQLLWTVEAEISFEARDEPVRVSLALPRSTAATTVGSEQFASPDYGFSVEDDGPVRRGVWTRRAAEGEQSLYYRVRVGRSRGAYLAADEPEPPVPQKPELSEPLRVAAGVLVERARVRSSDRISLAGELMRELGRKEPGQAAQVLLGSEFAAPTIAELTTTLLAYAGVPARVSQGLQLREGRRRSRLRSILEVHDGETWQPLDPKTGRTGLPEDFLLWRVGGEPLLDVEGGEGSDIRFSSLSDDASATDISVRRAGISGAALIDFSIFGLPVEEQKAFRLLLLIPIGALVVVIMRSLVGLRTSGTFMPILIALALLQTTLLVGLVLFVLLVSIGLMIRSYLSRLDLLLVPRISAVVIVVVFVMATVAVLSHKLDIAAGLRVTFFPMIILAWTIERTSVLWEEEGPWEVFVQVGGSLLVATLAYMAMMNRIVSHLAWTFPELLLVVLALILAIGQYTGFRLSELVRFEPLVREESREDGS